MQNPTRIDRRILLGLASRLYRRRVAPPPGGGKPERLLLVRVDERLGNLIGLQSLIDAIRGLWPGVELGLLCARRARTVTHSLAGLDRLHEIDKRWLFQSPARFRAALAAVREARYEVAVDASAWHELSFTHAALSWFSGAPMVIGTERSSGSGLHTHLVPPGPPEEYELRQRLRLLAPLGAPLGLEPPPLRSALGLASRERFAADLARQPRPRVGLYVGARKPDRRWPIPLFAALGQTLQDARRAAFVILWGPGEEALRDVLAAALGSAAEVAPPTDVEELAGLLRALDLVVVGDTGPMHLCVAVGTPTVCIFTSGEPTRWGHPGPRVRNLALKGLDRAEVAAACAAALELLDQA